jgi:predicted anti-sigma-YlaC factor YlaD
LEKKPPPADCVDCRAASRLLSAAYERKLTTVESRALTYHLDRCFMCRNFDSQLKFLHAASERFRSGDE